jgi:hypothetical protein
MYMRQMMRSFLVLLGGIMLWAWAFQGLALGEDSQGIGFSPSTPSTKLSPSILHGSETWNGRTRSERGLAFDMGAMDIDATGLQVYIELEDWSQTILDQLQAARVTIELTDPTQKLVQGRIPLDSLEQVARLPFVKFIRLPDYGYSNQQGSVGTQGDAVIRANLARQALGVTGAGIRVGVISDGLSGLSQSIASGDLPSVGITSQSFRADGNINAGAEGTALLEIVYDIAPGAQLFFANFDTSLAFIQAANWLADTAGGPNPRRGTPGGVDILVEDIAFFNVGPYDGSSSVSQALSGAAARGVAVFAAVGNSAGGHYRGLFTDTDGDTLNEFDVSLGLPRVDNAGETLNVTVQPGEAIGIFLQWNDPWGASSSDYDLCVYDPPDLPTAPILCSTTRQNGQNNPTEFIAIRRTASTPGTLGVGIINFQGQAPPRLLDLFIIGGVQREFVVPDHSVPNGGDAVNVLSVGAVNWQTPTVLESFSSRGPTNDGRVKPEVVAPDGVSVTGAGGFPTTFFGTSAAVPHAGAVAALMLEANPSLTPTRVHNMLEQTAAPLGTPIPNFDAGFGRIDAFAAVQAAVPPLVAAVLPSSRSVRVGTPATAFATMINTGQATALACGIAPATGLPVTFVFQTTDPVTNQLTGTPNTPVDIPVGGTQSFVVAFTPTAPIAPTDVALSFDCMTTDPARSLVGLNTLLLSAATTPTPDIVAMAATLQNNGIVDILGATGTGAFAVAAVNLGVGGAMTVSADTGGSSLPVSLTLCETNPTTGSCRAGPSPAVTTQIQAGATPTFGIFVTGQDVVPFAPATNRVFVRFKDSSGVTRGSTSVAARTR